MAKHVLNDEQYQKFKDKENAVPPEVHNAAISAMFRLGMRLGIGTGLGTALVGFLIVLSKYDLKPKIVQGVPQAFPTGPGGYVLTPPATAPATPIPAPDRPGPGAPDR